ncbi:YIP1 family protein [Candidatus Bathyarchaeota archaeon]|nr:YIP1 family protein [Candidatus Bathyarchaeota archaeon]
MSETKKSFREKIFGVLRSPSTGFPQIEEDDLRKGILIIFIIGLLSSWAGVIYLRARTTMPFLAIGGIVGAFTRWLIPSALVLISAKILIGDGSTRRLLAMTAFASLPQLAQQLLRVVDAYTISNVDLTALRATLFPSTGLVFRAMNQGVKVFNVFGLLTLALTVYAVSANYRSPKRRALTVSVLAYLAYILLKVFLPI